MRMERERFLKILGYNMLEYSRYYFGYFLSEITLHLYTKLCGVYFVFI